MKENNNFNNGNQDLKDEVEIFDLDFEGDTEIIIDESKSPIDSDNTKTYQEPHSLNNNNKEYEIIDFENIGYNDVEHPKDENILSKEPVIELNRENFNNVNPPITEQTSNENSPIVEIRTPNLEHLSNDIPVEGVSYEPNINNVYETNSNNVNINNNIQENDNNFDFDEEVKNKKSFAFLAPVIITTLIIGLTIYFVLDRETNNTKPTHTKPNTQQQVINESNKPWSGTYTNDKGTLEIYQIDESTIAFLINVSNSVSSGRATVLNKTNTAEEKNFDKYNFVLEENKINFSTDSKNFENGIFTKTKEYTKEDYFKSNYGDPTYLNSKINGIFKNGDTTIKIYQTSASQARMMISKGFSLYSTPINIKNNELVTTDNSFNGVEKIKIAIDDNSITVTSSSTDENGLLNKVNGTYQKNSPYTIDDIIKLDL